MPARIPAIGLTAKEATHVHDMLVLATREVESALAIAYQRNSEAHICSRYRELLRQSKNLLTRLEATS